MLPKVHGYSDKGVTGRQEGYLAKEEVVKEAVYLDRVQVLKAEAYLVKGAAYLVKGEVCSGRATKGHSCKKKRTRKTDKRMTRVR